MERTRSRFYPPTRWLINSEPRFATNRFRSSVRNLPEQPASEIFTSYSGLRAIFHGVTGDKICPRDPRGHAFNSVESYVAFLTVSGISAACPALSILQFSKEESSATPFGAPFLHDEHISLSLSLRLSLSVRENSDLRPIQKIHFLNAQASQQPRCTTDRACGNAINRAAFSRKRV